MRGKGHDADTSQVTTHFEIGRRIVEHEQEGAKRAAYGTELLKELSVRLKEEFGKGFSHRNLEYMRKFYLLWQSRQLEMTQTLSAKSGNSRKTQTLSAKWTASPIAQTTSGPFDAIPFTLSWSHYVELLGIKDPEERSFYEIESANSGWNVRELKRQKASALYQRLALSRDKAGIRRLAKEGQVITKPADLFKEPLVLDLVFYNRLLRCYVVIDLKLDKLTHQDLGQMQMYVNYYDRHVKLPEENLTIGLLLCRKKNDAVVELTLPKDANIHAKEYQLYLPSKEVLQAKLIEWAQEEESRR